MNTLEDKVRTALRLTAEEIPPYTVPPLRLPNGWRSPARRPRAYRHGWGQWLAPLAAAAAVTAVIAGSLAISGALHARPPTNRTSAAAALASVPPYYVTLTGRYSNGPTLPSSAPPPPGKCWPLSPRPRGSVAGSPG